MFYNWENPAHVRELARSWNIDPERLPSWKEPTHVMQMVRYAEIGDIKFFWIIATNPAVSLPELARIRRVLAKEDLFVVVQDAWRTETAELADLVLPAAIWGERTGTFTNPDRTCHISLKAIDPPGEARSDLEIFLDYARRMGFRDRDGNPLITYTTPEGAFNEFKALSRGRLVDYSGMSYAKLTGGSGIQWPCNERYPDGKERLYDDFVFPTAAEVCETYGKDLETGAAISPEQYRARDPGGRAILRAAEYGPPPEEPDGEYPFFLTTGRIVYHFHTRTKTGRSKELNEAAPDAFVQLAAEDAQRLGIAQGDMVLVESRRGRVVEPAVIGDVIPGHAFIPFHYGYWDEPGRPRAANELTLSMWDPVSKQPYFKFAAVKLSKFAGVPKALAFVPPAREVVRGLKGEVDAALGAVRAGNHFHAYLGLLRAAEEQLAEALKTIAQHHAEEKEFAWACTKFAGWCQAHVGALQPFINKYQADPDDEPQQIRKAMFQGPRVGHLGLMRDLQDAWLMAHEVQICWLGLKQGAEAIRDPALLAACNQYGEQTDLQIAWFHTQFKSHISEALLLG